jgi:hypothetical protein
MGAEAAMEKRVNRVASVLLMVVVSAVFGFLGFHAGAIARVKYALWRKPGYEVGFIYDAGYYGLAGAAVFAVAGLVIT